LEVCGISEKDDSMDIAKKIGEALRAEEWEEGADASSTHILFDILPEITDKPEAYLLYFMVAGYQQWVEMVNASVFHLREKDKNE
jgi:hypothetical protein